MGFVQEFKEFAVKGNVVDMAVGVIIGGAFGKIVTSMVGDVMMPLIGLATAGKRFDTLFVALDGKEYPSLEEAAKAGTAVLKYGAFLQTVFDFLIVALCIFIAIKQMNRLTKKPAAAK
jgi:large conductance mechanosensitive channel